MREIISDVSLKLDLLSKWKYVYPLAENYDAFLDSCYTGKVRSFIYLVGTFLSHMDSTKHITYDLSCIPGLADFLRLWNNYNLNGRLIYRATTTLLIDDYVRSRSGVSLAGGDDNLLSFWSVSPYTSHYFAVRYTELFHANPRDVRVLVMEYDDSLCAKDWYDNFTPEYSVYNQNYTICHWNIHYIQE